MEQRQIHTDTQKCTHAVLLTLIIVSHFGTACVGGRWGEMWSGVTPSVGDYVSDSNYWWSLCLCICGDLRLAPTSIFWLFRVMSLVPSGSRVPNDCTRHFKSNSSPCFSTVAVHQDWLSEMVSHSIIFWIISPTDIFSLLLFCRRWRSVLLSSIFSTWFQLHHRIWWNLYWKWLWRLRGPCS